MDFYSFARIFFAWIATITCLPILNIVFIYFAHRIREAQLAEDDERRFDSDELRTRSLLSALALTAATVVFIFLDVVAAEWLAVPAGLVHFAVLLMYVAACAFLLTYLFASEDFFAGLGDYALAVGLPLLVLWPIDWLFGWWQPVLRLVLYWLKEVPPPAGY